MSLRWRIKVFSHWLRNFVVYLVVIPFTFKNWFYVFYGRFTHQPGLLHLRNGLRFKVRPKTTDRAVISEIFILKTYEYPLPGYQICPGNVVIDIGANIGAFTLFAAAKKASQVFAVEPVKETFELLKENGQLNSLKNVSYFNLAIDSRDGVRDIHVGHALSSFFWKNKFSDFVESVPTLSLSSFVIKNKITQIDFLKMDCEGAEFDILFNTDTNILQRIHRMGIEFHNISPEKNATTLAAFLKAKGFTVDRCSGEWNGLLFARYFAR